MLTRIFLLFSCGLFLGSKCTYASLPGSYISAGTVVSADYTFVFVNWGILNNFNAFCGEFDGLVGQNELDPTLLNLGLSDASQIPERNGQVTKVTTQHQISSPLGSPNYVTNQLSIDFIGQYTGSQVLVQLESGSIFNDSQGEASGAAPVSSVDPNSSLAYDTFLSLGSSTQDSFPPFGFPTPGNGPAEFSLVGGAVDLGGGFSPVTTSLTDLDIAWGPDGKPIGSADTSFLDFLAMQLTLSNDAEGTISFLSSVDENIFRVEGVVRNGRVIIPEPSSIILISVCAFSFGKNRRNSLL